MQKKLPKKQSFIFSETPHEALYDLIYSILRYGNLGVSRLDFLREVSTLLADFSGCDVVELRIKERDKYFCCIVSRKPKKSYHFEITPSSVREYVHTIPDTSDVERLCLDLITRHFIPHPSFFSEKGSFWTCTTDKTYELLLANGSETAVKKYFVDGEYSSIAMIPIYVGDEKAGLLFLKSKEKEYFTQDLIRMYDSIARNIGIAIIDRQTHMSLRERIKEMTCLYNIAQLIENPGMALADILKGIVEFLPPSLLYPDIAFARIILDGVSYSTPGFRLLKQNLKAPVVVNNNTRGTVEVCYKRKKPELDMGPFLKEEVSLIEAVAKQVALIVERKQAEEETVRLQDQLRHADRLATIGQLAAGVAHELNEPLSNILGFSQLAVKSSELPQHIAQDIEKIINASLHAREIIKKLQLFARQMPPSKSRVNLNHIVNEGLYFFESRCTKVGIELLRSLSPDIPEIIADSAQLNQVLVNLVVNALQAMPDGGKLTVRTFKEGPSVFLIIEDTGIGMNGEVMKQIFIPFFTTKDVGQGTGLGLAVVHGIIASHGGLINVESEIGQGTRFTISLPINKPDNHE